MSNNIEGYLPYYIEQGGVLVVKRFVSLVMCIVLLVTASVFTVHAESVEDAVDTPMPCYLYSTNVKASLNISNGQATRIIGRDIIG